MGKKIFSLFVLIITDLFVILLSFWLAHTLRSDILPKIIPRFKDINLLPLTTFLNHFYLSIVWILIFAHEKLYTKRYPFWQEVKVLVKSATLSFVFIMVMIFITRKQIQFSRTIVILAWLLSLVLFPLMRYMTKYLLVKFNLWKKKLIILGVHQTSLAITKSIKKNVTMGYEVLGFLDNDPHKLNKKFLGIQVLGPLSEMEDIAKSFQSKDIMVATPHLPRNQLRELLAKCENMSESMWLIPRSGDFITEGVELEVMGDVLTLFIKKNLAKPWNILIKSVFDKFLTLVALILLSPLLLLIVIAVRIDSKGPAIFVQKRVGRNKRIFRLFKFRSMYMNCDKKLTEYFSDHPESKKEWEKYKKIKNHDPRVTRVGRIIRKYSLDELPQLFNVLTGEMSLVGPRPYIAEELEGKEKFTKILSRVKPGITGLWQISGRSELTFDQRLDLDEYYIRNWSLWLDIVILLKSIKVLFSSKGAY
jgi:undecaprenyl-phosphate galactose phosphotransferase